jgi:hypothetical protein
MNIEKKILRLLEHGFNTSTLADLKPKQIEALYNRLVEAKEENNEAEILLDPKNPADMKMAQEKGIATADGKIKTPMSEVDNTETEDIALAVSEKDPDLGLAMSEDLNEKFESKKQQKYFFAKCGDGKTKEQKKWCKMAKEFADSTKDFSKLPEKKDETNEDFSFKNYLEKVGSTIAGNIAKEVPNSLRPTFEGKLEESIMKMVNKHITPKMTKKDFIKTITEAEKEVETPVKPDVKPERPRPQTPYQPKHKPAPKAGEREVETPVKPDVKPERPRPATPYQPKHKPAPKAEDVPQWLTFDAIGINLK